jgi:diguanylate cyclase (GGDEF)-like protein
VAIILNSSVSLYNGVLTSLITFYTIYQLNRDCDKPRLNDYIMPVLLTAVYSSQLIVIFPNVSLTFKLISNFLVIILSTKLFLKYNIFNSLISGALSIVILGIGDVIVSILYVLPLKITFETYTTSFFHIAIGSVFMFFTAFCFIKFLGERLINIRNYALKKNYKLMIILATDFVSMLLLLLISYNTYLVLVKNFKIFNEQTNTINNMIFIVIILSVIIAVTIYSLNSSIINKLKFDQAMDNYYIDDLTGVLNRKAGISLLRKQLKFSQQKKQSFTICYIDINKLKEVNDTYGHKQGDRLITEIINVIKENIRKADKISRLGGDEFIIIFPDYNIKEAEIITKRVLKELGNTKWKLDDGYAISFSYGFAQCNGETYETVESLIEKADKQMYQFKRLYKEGKC